MGMEYIHIGKLFSNASVDAWYGLTGRNFVKFSDLDAVYEGSWSKGEAKGVGKFIHLSSGIIQYGCYENGNWKITNQQ